MNDTEQKKNAIIFFILAKKNKFARVMLIFIGVSKSRIILLSIHFKFKIYNHNFFFVRKHIDKNSVFFFIKFFLSDNGVKPDHITSKILYNIK